MLLYIEQTKLTIANCHAVYGAFARPCRIARHSYFQDECRQLNEGKSISHGMPINEDKAGELLPVWYIKRLKADVYHE